MRRRISLYIGDRLADLDEQSLILFNYRLEDLTNPTVVKNSYSQQVTLKGTPTNNAIFGDMFRLDRVVDFGTGSQIGAGFNPSVRTPFTIYDETGAVLESGYLKLDSVNHERGMVEYKVTLYGGMGSFLYSLAYDEDGNKKTLADLAYLESENPETELDFTINVGAVQEAWNTEQGGEVDNRWKVINFAPAYNGVPDGDFSADKALVVPSAVGLANSVVDEGKTYTLKSGYALVNLAEGQEEWSVKDLRSYLQRPVFSMRAFWNAIANPENNGGYTVDLRGLEDEYDFPYYDLWMTLPMLPSISSERSREGAVALQFTPQLTTGNIVGRYDMQGGELPAGTTTRASLNCKLRFYSPNDYSSPGVTRYRVIAEPSTRNYESFQAVIFVQALAYASDGTLVGGSKVKTFYNGAVEDIAGQCRYLPMWRGSEDIFEELRITETSFSRVEQRYYQYNRDLSFVVEGQDVAYFLLHVASYNVHERVVRSAEGERTYVLSAVGGSAIPTLWRAGIVTVVPTGTTTVEGSSASSISYTLPTTLRSGAYVTKRMLLSTTYSPADYLLSLCKMFGLHILYDSATRVVTILRRSATFEDDVIDLSERVDVSKSINILPIAFNAKWYEFTTESVGGAFADEYEKIYARPYGMKRINTGYNFNKEATNLMSEVVFRNAVTILDRSRHFNIIRRGGAFIPSPFLETGNTYTLWSAEGQTLDVPISCPPNDAAVEYYNTQYEGYDIDNARKVQFCDASRKPIAGEGVLLFWDGFSDYDSFKLSDDVPAMDLLNEGVPCWLLGEGQSVAVPIFNRYKAVRYTRGDWWIVRALDFGMPAALDIPGVKYEEAATIYDDSWRRYIQDRYDVNTKVMTCRVDFRGLRVGPNLLRKFYWYGGSLWSLNAVKNYSLTTFDTVECEFVQVQDKDNYLNR